KVKCDMATRRSQSRVRAPRRSARTRITAVRGRGVRAVAFAGLDDIDVGSSLHEGAACAAGCHWIKSSLCAINLGKEKAGRLPLSDRPLLS
ncbi:MAG: hypothetical protein UR94_C0022G0026, partial [Parcubacteria group bacterium GW2011_GWA2_36_10]